MSVLPPADALDVPVDSFAELLLGEADHLAGGANLRPDGPAAGEYPGGGWVEVHPPTLN